MKSIHKLAAVAVLALSSAGLASAQTGTYHVTGSTAYRNADVAGEVALCGGSSAVAIYWGSASKGLSGANYSIVANASGTLVFENFWNGSIAGDVALVDPTALAFPKYSAYSSSMTACTAGAAPSTNAGGGFQVNAPTTWPTGITVDSHVPDIAFSDVYFDTAQQILQASTPPDSHTLASVSASQATVGVVPFVFVANATSDFKSELGTTGVAPATVSLSMDPQKFSYVWGSPAGCNLAYFTGNSADATALVYAMGRDADSGTRGTSLSETGYGLQGSGIVTTTVNQYYAYDTDAHYQADESAATADPTGVAGFNATTGVVGDDSSATTIGEMELVPYESVDNYEMGAPGSDGDGGYYSGGNLATAISSNFNGPTKTVLMTSLGVSDAKTALTGTNPAALMAYNGVVFYPTSTVPTGVTVASNAAEIYYGKYTFWGYEHEFYLNTASTAAVDLKNQLYTNGLDELSSNQVTFQNMKVSRTDDGQNIQ